MFTGIIYSLGRILKKTSSNLTVQTGKDFTSQLKKGSSVAINGICLTVIKFHDSSVTTDYIPETLKRTNIKYLKIGDLVNLELSATPSTFLSGHVVQGHIDGLAKLENITKDKNSFILRFSVDKTLSKYIVEKGSIAINGVSLTIIETENDCFTVGIIPHTWEKTMLHTLNLGDFTNIEVDILAKYLEKISKK